MPRAKPLRSLYLFRHAKASQGGKEGPHDHERPLTEDGVAAARAVGAALRAGGQDLGYALCSTSRRTVETYENVAFSYPGLPAVLDRAVYEADVPRLLSLVQAFDDRHAHATVFGHNPTHHDLAVMLATHGTPKLLAKLAHTFSPGTVARIDFDVDHWDHVVPELGTLGLLLAPHDLMHA
mgnify:CR=1 FL=1